MNTQLMTLTIQNGTQTTLTMVEFETLFVWLMKRQTKFDTVQSVMRNSEYQKIVDGLVEKGWMRQRGPESCIPHNTYGVVAESIYPIMDAWLRDVFKSHTATPRQIRTALKSGE